MNKLSEKGTAKLADIKKNVRSALRIKTDTNYYSQGGEDAIVSKTFYYLLPVMNGFYIDIGAYHPYKHSNTYILYKSGWRGMNIDPRPGSKKLFDRYRKRDINIEAGIAARDGTMLYYIIDEKSTMNTFSKENLEKLKMFDKVKRTVEIPVFELNTLLNQYKEIQSVDYLNIDTEGFEMDILAGLNFNEVAPKVISIEQNNILTLSDVLDSTVCKFLSGKGYVPYAKNILLNSVSTVFYIQNKYLA